MYYLGSMDQESESGLAWWFWLRVSHDVIAKMVAQASVIWRFNRSETTSQIIWWLLAGISFSVAIGQKPCSSPDNHHSFSECCNDMATDFPQNECPKREREPKMEGTVVYNLLSELTYHYFCNLLDQSFGHIVPTLAQWKRRLYEGANIRSMDHRHHLRKWVPHKILENI